MFLIVVVLVNDDNPVQQCCHCLWMSHGFMCQYDNVVHGVFQSMYSRVPECQITTYYYVGFAYLMMRRYQDAIRVFANILLYIQRTRNMFQRTTYKYEMVSEFEIKSICSICIIFVVVLRYVVC